MRATRIFAPCLFALVFSNHLLAQDNPAYDENTSTLTIPAVDGIDSAGQYQDIVLQTSDGENWQMIAGNAGRQISEISSVELIKIDSFPTQIILEVAGTFNSGCPSIGHIVTRLTGTEFEVSVNYTYIPNPSEIGCTAALVDFSKFILLPVYGLDAGDYTYTVNSDVLTSNNTGSFTLDEDNFYLE